MGPWPRAKDLSPAWLPTTVLLCPGNDYGAQDLIERAAVVVGVGTPGVFGFFLPPESFLSVEPCSLKEPSTALGDVVDDFPLHKILARTDQPERLEFLERRDALLDLLVPQ